MSDTSIKALTTEEFLATMELPATGIPTDAPRPFDFWRYFEQIAPAEFRGHDCGEGRVAYIWEMKGGQFRHVFIGSENPNIFLVLVLDCAAGEVLGHRLVDVTNERGVEARPLLEHRLSICREFEEKFLCWLGDVMRRREPEGSHALVFELFEPVAVGAIFGMTMCGLQGFDADASEWNGEQIWEEGDNELLLPVEYTLNGWEACESKVRDLVTRVLSEDDNLAKQLKKFSVVVVGFGEGQPAIAWRKTRYKQ